MRWFAELGCFFDNRHLLSFGLGLLSLRGLEVDESGSLAVRQFGVWHVKFLQERHDGLA